MIDPFMEGYLAAYRTRRFGWLQPFVMRLWCPYFSPGAASIYFAGYQAWLVDQTPRPAPQWDDVWRLTTDD